MVERKCFPDCSLQRLEPSRDHPKVCVCVSDGARSLLLAAVSPGPQSRPWAMRGGGTFRGCARHASVPPKGTTFLSWYPRTFPSPCCLGVELPWSSSWEDGGVVSVCGEEWRPRDGPGCASVMSSPGGEAETPAQASRCSLCPHFYSME